jgi:hypothetical protein
MAKAKRSMTRIRNMQDGGLRSKEEDVPWALVGLDRGPQRKIPPQASSIKAHER